MPFDTRNVQTGSNFPLLSDTWQQTSNQCLVINFGLPVIVHITFLCFDVVKNNTSVKECSSTTTQQLFRELSGILWQLQTTDIILNINHYTLSYDLNRVVDGPMLFPFVSNTQTLPPDMHKTRKFRIRRPRLLSMIGYQFSLKLQLGELHENAIILLCYINALLLGVS